MKQRNNQQNDLVTLAQEKLPLCENLSFSAAEAYKMLRNNIMFTLPDQEHRIIGITSSIQGECKSTTSINLAYTIAQTGRKVLLIDGDMRLPSIARRLGIPGTPGLSNMVARLSGNAIVSNEAMGNWYVLPAGDLPPNPSELMGSKSMAELIKECGDTFDYVIVDLPPVNIVSDTLSLMNALDGLIVVVRKNYCTRGSLDDCMKHLDFMKKKVLGFVISDEKLTAKNYGHSYKHGYRNDKEFSTSYKHAEKKKKAAAKDSESRVSEKRNISREHTAKDYVPYVPSKNISIDENPSSGKNAKAE